MLRTSWMCTLMLFLLQNWLAEAKAPTITRQPSDTFANKGGVAELQCAATGSPPLTYEWYHNDKRVRVSNRKKIFGGNLFITRVVHKKKKHVTDTGRYYCVVRNNDGDVRSQVVRLSLGYIRKRFRSQPKSQSISRGNDLVLTCIPPRGKPKPKIRWWKDSLNVNVDGGRISLQNHDQKLVIKNFEENDEGSYQCVAYNVGGRTFSNVAKITSTVRPYIVSQPKNKRVDMRIQSEVSFSCKADGVPAPRIMWKKKGNESVLPSGSDGKLIIKNIQPSDMGSYVCIAYNSVGNATAVAQLVVESIPVFVNVPSDVVVKEGSKLKLKCLANSVPSPAISWRRRNHPHQNIRTQRDDRTMYLIFSRIKLSDAGVYVCVARNMIGSRKHEVNISVYDKSEYPPALETPGPKISADINSNATIICDVDGNPKPVVTWSKVGEVTGLGGGISSKDYVFGTKRRYVLTVSKVRQSNGGIFQCKARNKIKTVVLDINLHVTNKIHLSQPVGMKVPRRPRNVHAVNYNDNSVLINWDPSPDHVLVYAVGYINVDERSNEQYASIIVAPTRYDFVVRKLTPNTRYRFFVRGVNVFGHGAPSLLSDIVTTNPAAPTRPIVASTVALGDIKFKIRVRSAGPGELLVSWEKLSEGVRISGYYIFWQVEDFTGEVHKETLQNNSTTSYTISDLQNNTKYSVQVQPFMDSSEGPMSEIAKKKTSKKAIILTMRVNQKDSDSLAVTWNRLWKRNSGEDFVRSYTVWHAPADNLSDKQKQEIPATATSFRFVIGNLIPGISYKVWMTVSTTLGRQYRSEEKFITLRKPIAVPRKSTMAKIKEFILQPWFLGVIGGVVLICVMVLLLCCLCRRSSPKKNVDNLSIQLENREQLESVRKPSENSSPENDVVTPINRVRESTSECAESYDGRSSSVYRYAGSPRTPTGNNFDFPSIAITPNKYERMYRSLEAKGSANVNYGRPPRKYSENEFDSPSRYVNRSRNPYSPVPKQPCHNIDDQSDYDNAKPKCERASESGRSPAHDSYPGDAPPDYETAVAENIPLKNDYGYQDRKLPKHKDLRDDNMERMPYRSERYGSPSSRQSPYSPGSECSHQGSSIAGRRKGLKPLPRLTIASVNWADMLPPPPSHPPPSSVATYSPPPSPTATSMCSETTYGRSHASSFLPRRSGSLVSADMASDLEKETADSVRSGKSKGKSENKLPFDLAGITSDIIMQWADSVTNTSGSEDESACSSPDRRSGISSDGSFLTDTDFANAVKAAAECGGFNIDIDLNMYKTMDPISFQPFAGSLSNYNSEPSKNSRKDSNPSSMRTVSPKETDIVRETPNRARRSRPSVENTRDTPATANSTPPKDNSAYGSANISEPKNNRKPRHINEMSSNGSTGYVPALTRTSALGKLEPVNRGAVKKKYAVVKTLPQVQDEDNTDYTSNYPSHSLSSSTSNASTIRSSSCPPVMLSDEDTEDDVI